MLFILNILHVLDQKAQRIGLALEVFELVGVVGVIDGAEYFHLGDGAGHLLVISDEERQIDAAQVGVYYAHHGRQYLFFVGGGAVADLAAGFVQAHLERIVILVFALAVLYQHAGLGAEISGFGLGLIGGTEVGHVERLELDGRAGMVFHNMNTSDLLYASVMRCL